VVPSVPTEVIVVPLGIPAPVTSMPASSPAVETRPVTVGLLRVSVASLLELSLNCHAVPPFLTPDNTYTEAPRGGGIPTTGTQAPAATV